MSSLAADMSAITYQNLFAVWLQMLKSQVAAEESQKFRAAFGQDVAILIPQEIESAIISSGFDTPVLFLQTALIHAWYAIKSV